MRSFAGTRKISIQYGKMSVNGDGSSSIVANEDIDSTVDVAVVMTPVTNVSITPHKQSEDVFLVTTSDIVDTTTNYLIVSTS